MFEGGEVAGTPKYVQGEKVNDNYTVISADNGGTYTQHVEFPYDDRMEQSELRVLIESKCNGASEYVMFNAATGKPVTKEEAAVLANPEVGRGHGAARSVRRVHRRGRQHDAERFQLRRRCRYGCQQLQAYDESG